MRLTKYSNLMELGLQLNLEKWEPVYCASDDDDKVSAFTNIIVHTVFPRTNVAAFIKFFALRLRRLFEGGVNYKYLNSLIQNPIFNTKTQKL